MISNYQHIFLGAETTNQNTVVFFCDDLVIQRLHQGIQDPRSRWFSGQL
jgi:hypothetical protein